MPVTLSATHAAFGSIRMEPTYMILGHSAAVAACMAISGGTSVQDVSYPELRARLIEQRQVLCPRARTDLPKMALQLAIGSRVEA